MAGTKAPKPARFTNYSIPKRIVFKYTVLITAGQVNLLNSFLVVMP